MNTPFFISWRYQRGKQKNPLVALIAKFSAVGIALGVAVLIVGLSAMNGFERELNAFSPSCRTRKLRLIRMPMRQRLITKIC